jgi:hypothetical protein
MAGNVFFLIDNATAESFLVCLSLEDFFLDCTS